MTELESAIAAFLPRQRWFAGKARQIGEVGIEARSVVGRHPGALILETKPPRDGVFYDAVADERLGAVFLDLLSRAATLDQLRFHRAPEWNETLRGPGKLLDAEQTNSSLVFSNRLILKLF